jgi:type IV pilus assembly protein PilB
MIISAQLREIILKSGFVTSGDFDAAVKTSEELGKNLTDILIYRGLVSEEALGQIIAEYYQVPYIKISHKTVPLEILKLIPEEAASTFHVIPFAREANELSLAMQDPSDLEAREFVKRKTGMKVKIYYASDLDIANSMGQYKKDIKDVFTKIIAENLQISSVDTSDEAKLANDMPVIKILDTILEFAAAEGASDVHMEAAETEFLVRFRVDGVLQDILTLPKNIHPAIVARIKILAQLKIDEHRIPQDGRFKFRIKDSFIALRVSILPSFYGENIVLRILSESARPLALEELGVTGHNLELVKRNIKKPHGMILVTGPTGSGKTTTLYSVLNILISTEVNICTVEDPVEYGIKRVNQTQINPSAGLSFAAGLRSLLRHDPDIIMVGEIRDSETVEMAIQSSLTGHLVLSTLHTNDAAGTIPRLIDMGAEGFLVASTLNLVIAQRLVRKICTSCIEPVTMNDEMMQYLSKYVEGDKLENKFYRGRGCDECNHKGYKGRIGIFEILEVNDEIRKLAVGHVSSENIAQSAMKNGMVRLIRDGINKASGGITTVEEVIRVLRE